MTPGGFPRARAAALTFALALALAGCGGGGGGSGTVPPPPPTSGPTAASVVYAAIGASDAVGYNASIPCDPALLVAIAACPGGTGYVPDLARSLAVGTTVVTLDDLGISGDVVAPDIAALTNRYENSGAPGACMPRVAANRVGDFTTDELPKLTGRETLVTVFAGANDTNGIVNAAACQVLAGTLAPAGVDAYLATQVAAFGADFNRLIAAVRAKSPHATIVVANLPNLGAIPFAASLPTVKPYLRAVSVQIDTTVYLPAASGGLAVVDLLCDAASYAPGNYAPGPHADGFHPNDAGYAALAAAFAARIAGPIAGSPAAACSAMSLAAGGTTSVLRPLPAFERPGAPRAPRTGNGSAGP